MIILPSFKNTAKLRSGDLIFLPDLINITKIEMVLGSVTLTEKNNNKSKFLKFAMISYCRKLKIKFKTYILSVIIKLETQTNPRSLKTYDQKFRKLLETQTQ